MPLSSVKGASQGEVFQALSTFEQCLAQEDLLASRNLSRLSSPTARHKVHVEGLQRMTHSYRRVVEAIQNAANGYEAGLVKTTPEHVGILLGL